MHSSGNHRRVVLFTNMEGSDVQDEQLNDMVLMPNLVLVLPNLLFLVRYNWSYTLG